MLDRLFGSIAVTALCGLLDTAKRVAGPAGMYIVTSPALSYTSHRLGSDRMLPDGIQTVDRVRSSSRRVFRRSVGVYTTMTTRLVDVLLLLNYK